jgi:hypothetical protein
LEFVGFTGVNGMITEKYMTMTSEVGVRSMDYGEETVGKERERGYDIFRSPSAPPTIDGNGSVGGLFSVDNGGNGVFSREVSEDELRSDPAYINYYYSSVNLNPRLPPPLLSKEDWRFAQRLSSGPGNGSGLGGIGDRRKVIGGINNREEEFNVSNNNGNNGDINNNRVNRNSMFSVGFNGVKNVITLSNFKNPRDTFSHLIPVEIFIIAHKNERKE